MSGEIMEEFRKARREDRKLETALAALFPDQKITAEEREELLQYLCYRKRSAAMELIRRGSLDGLRHMAERGWLEEPSMESFRKEAVRLRELEIWAWLCERERKGRKASGSLPEQGKYSSGEAGASALCEKIWKLTGRKLRMKLPGMAEALGTMEFCASKKARWLAGDGFSVQYRREGLLENFADAPDQVARSLLHLLLHQLYLHPVLGRKKNRRYWDLACDIQTERLLDQWDIRGLTREGRDYRAYLLKENGLLPGRENAERLYRVLCSGAVSAAGTEKLEEAFRQDDHCLWEKYRNKEALPEEEGAGREGGTTGREGTSESVRFLKKWNRIRKKLGIKPDGTHQKAGTAPGGAVQKVSVRKQKEYDYRNFLQEFMVCREEVELDTDSFDYLPYWYSRTHYRGIVFLEPLEYREIHKLDEIVIAIDTSGSCSGRVVKRFLEETFRILTERGNFFSRMQVHILQCDSMIQEHVLIRSREEFLEYIEQVTVKGLGGTDFRPVFRLTDQLIAEKKIQDLKALLYFTDGDGVYPQEKPAYETAFIFLNSQYEKQEIPEWGIRLNLGLRLEEE